MPKLDPSALPDPSVLLESFEHPKHGYLDYDPHTLAIRQPEGRRPVWRPIGIPERFTHVKQPYVPTCSEPREGNKGCPKWHGCPLKAYPFIGPGQVIARKKDAVSVWDCVDFFSEKDEHGKLVFQINGVEQGWKMDTSKTTTTLAGHEPILKNGEETGKWRKVKWEKEWPDLLAYWWPLLKKQGKPLPESAKRYPQFAEDDEEGTSTNDSGLPALLPSVSPVGRKKRRKVGKRKGRVSRSVPLDLPSSDTPGQDV